MQNSINPFNIRPANRVNNISEYYFSKKLKEIAELNARGLDIINLGIGGPDRPPHPETIETLCTESRKSDVHGYQPYIGIPELRRAFADWYNRWYNVTLDPQKEIQPLIGSKEGIFAHQSGISQCRRRGISSQSGIPHIQFRQPTGRSRNFHLRPR